MRYCFADHQITRSRAITAISPPPFTISTDDMPHLFEPLRIRGVEFPHRIFVSPMCQYSCHDGLANEWHLVHLGSRAVRRAAAVFVEAHGFSPIGRIRPDGFRRWIITH